MNRLFWVRHGESFVNLTKKFSYRLVDEPLTERGILQARQTADFFAGQDVEAIYCSPMLRTRQTAGIIAERLGRSVDPLENFRENNIGDLENGPSDEPSWAFYFGIIDAWKRGDLSVKFPGGEDGFTMLERMRTGLAHVVAGRENANLIVVGHGGSFSLTMRYLLIDVDRERLLQQPVENCSISEIVLDGGGAQMTGHLVRWSDTRHLAGEAADITPGIPDEHYFKGR